MKNCPDFFRLYKDAAENRDSAVMAELYDEEVVIFDLWDAGTTTGLDAWSKAIRDWFSSLGEDVLRVDFSRIRVTEKGDLAFADAIVTYSAFNKAGEKLRSMKNRFTVNFVKKPGQWKVLHQHTSIPIDSANITPIFG